MEGLALTEARLAREKARSARARRDRLPRPLGRREARSDRARRLAHGGRSRDAPHLAPARAPRRGGGRTRSSARACARRRGVVPAAELVGVRRALSRHGAPGGGEPADADLPPPRALFMLRLAESRVFIAPERFRGFDHGALARELAAELPGLKLVGLDGASRGVPARGAPAARRRHAAPLYLRHDRRVEGRAAHVEHPAQRGQGPAAPSAARRARRDLHAFAARAPARLHVRHADVAHARHSHRADRRVARGPRGAADPRRAPLRLCGDAFLADLVEGTQLPSLRVFASAGRLFRRRWCRPRASGSASPWRPPGA